MREASRPDVHAQDSDRDGGEHKAAEPIRHISDEGRRIELLRHRHEGRIVRIEDVDNLGEIGKRPGQPVDLTWECSSQGGVLDSVAREENSVGCCGIQGLSPIP